MNLETCGVIKGLPALPARSQHKGKLIGLCGGRSRYIADPEEELAKDGPIVYGPEGFTEGED